MGRKTALLQKQNIIYSRLKLNFNQGIVYVQKDMEELKHELTRAVSCIPVNVLDVHFVLPMTQLQGLRF